MSKRPRPTPAPLPPGGRPSKPPTEIEEWPRQTPIAMRDLVACPTCRAQPGDWCWNYSPMDGPVPGFLHWGRQRNAAAVKAAMQNTEGCLACGTWVCLDCGWTRRNANRSGWQDCGGCGSSWGQWYPVHHRNPIKMLDHREEFLLRRAAVEPPDAGSLTPVDPVHAIEASLDATLLTDGPVIRAEEGWRTDETWQSRWYARLVSVVSAQDPWGLLGQRPDGDVMLFDTTPAGIRRCAEWATAVRCVFPRGHRYDAEWGM